MDRHAGPGIEVGLEVLEVLIGLFVVAVDPQEIDFHRRVPVTGRFLGKALDQLEHTVETVAAQALGDQRLGRFVFQRDTAVGELFLFVDIGIKRVDGVNAAVALFQTAQQIAGGQTAVAADLDHHAAVGHPRRPVTQHAGFGVPDHAAVGLLVVGAPVQQADQVVIDRARKTTDQLRPPVGPGFVEKRIGRLICTHHNYPATPTNKAIIQPMPKNHTKERALAQSAM